MTKKQLLKLLVALVQLFAILPSLFYIAWTVLVAIRADEMTWLLFWFSMPAIIAATIINKLAD